MIPVRESWSVIRGAAAQVSCTCATVGGGVAPGRRQVGPHDGVVQHVEVRGHAVVAFVVV